MKTYLVTWSIEVDAENPVDAAEGALLIQRDKSSLATNFHVKDTKTGQSVEVDLYFEGLKNHDSD